MIHLLQVTFFRNVFLNLSLLSGRNTGEGDVGEGRNLFW